MAKSNEKVKASTLIRVRFGGAYIYIVIFSDPDMYSYHLFVKTEKDVYNKQQLRSCVFK